MGLVLLSHVENNKNHKDGITSQHSDISGIICLPKHKLTKLKLYKGGHAQ